MLISVLNQKGGVGKTTLTVHLTGQLADRGFNVTAIDADGQGATKDWLEQACPGVTCFFADEAEKIPEAVRILEPHVDAIIADGPPGLDEKTQSLLWLTDLAIIPTEPSLLDLKATAQALEIVRVIGGRRDKGPISTVVVLNCFRSNSSVSDEAAEALGTLGVPVAKTSLGLRDAVKKARQQNTIVTRMGWAGRSSAKELVALFEEVLPPALRGKKGGQKGSRPAGARRSAA